MTIYLQNTWYAAGFSEELTQQPLGRTLLGRPMVLYRTASGQPVALDDRCPHRFAPLHQGAVFGDDLRCPYHGLRFGPSGQCVQTPMADARIPKAAAVDRFPLVERDGIVWLWWGDAVPDESTIRRWPQFDDTAHYTTVQGYINVKGEYQLVSDNLLDLSHAEFLHPYLATDGFNKRTQYSMEQDGNTVVARNWRPGENCSQLFAMAYDEPPEKVDHLSIVTWQPPSTLHLRIGVTRVGRPAEEGPCSQQAHLVTPETDGRCHYFWKWARDFKLGDAEFSTRLQAAIQSAFETEDGPMIEAQYRYMYGQPLEDLRPVLLATDSASMRARRVLAQLIKAQQGGAETPQRQTGT